MKIVIIDLMMFTRLRRNPASTVGVQEEINRLVSQGHKVYGFYYGEQTDAQYLPTFENLSYIHSPANLSFVSSSFVNALHIILKDVTLPHENIEGVIVSDFLTIGTFNIQLNSDIKLYDAKARVGGYDVKEETVGGVHTRIESGIRLIHHKEPCLCATYTLSQPSTEYQLPSQALATIKSSISQQLYDAGSAVTAKATAAAGSLLTTFSLLRSKAASYIPYGNTPPANNSETSRNGI